jgi:flagellar biosynthesis/type III secretory pathway M-ring protein FliF/YscJ
MSTSNRGLSAVAAIGVAIFVIVILFLHLAQPDYNPLTTGQPHCLSFQLYPESRRAA